MVEGEWQLEYPIGHVLWRPARFLYDFLRVSPDGTKVALVDGTGFTLVDRSGRRTRLPAGNPHYSAWTPRGDALVVASSGVSGSSTAEYRTLYRLGIDGKLRDLYPVPGTVIVHDVSRDGRVLIHHGFEREGTRARAPGEADEREMGVSQASIPVALSADGSQVLLNDAGGPAMVSLLRPTRGGPEVRLGEGQPVGLSDDGRWALMKTSEGERQGLILTPVGVGSPISLRVGSLTVSRAFHVEAQRVGFIAAEPDRPRRSFWVEPPDGQPAPVTPEGVIATAGLLQSDRILGVAADGSVALYAVHGGPVQPLPWSFPPRPWTYALRVSGDSRSLYVAEGEMPQRIDQVDIPSGRRTPLMVLGAEPRAGISHIYRPYVTPDGKGYAYGYGEWLQDLYLVEGLRF
jgi:hypothetical protein